MSISDAGAGRDRAFVELRTGTPYAKLIAHQLLFAGVVGRHFGINPDNVMPTAGTSGAIEAIRNHVVKQCRTRNPTLLTVSPGYWRARESFQGLGFNVIAIETEAKGFAIQETDLVQTAREKEPELIYLSLPNNPTGAFFNPEIIVDGAPQETAIVFDLTLPSRDLDQTLLVKRLCRDFSQRRNLFFAGSTSKAYETAEYRIGWAICANDEDAGELKRQNRNVISTISIDRGIECLSGAPPSLDNIDLSFSLLRNAEKSGRFTLVRPERATETGYVLIRLNDDAEEIREILERERIRVMWGSELALSDRYIRLETLEPLNIKAFLSSMKWL